MRFGFGLKGVTRVEMPLQATLDDDAMLWLGHGVGEIKCCFCFVTIPWVQNDGVGRVIS